MSWITLIWSINAGLCLALAGIQLLVWAKSKKSWANLLFAIAAAAAAANALAELALMRAGTPAQFGVLLRIMHVPLFVLVVSLVWFVRLYLGTGRLWLGGLITGLRVVTLVLTFSLHPNLNFLEITDLNRISIWGDSFVVPIGTKNPWTNITHLSGVLLFVFVFDAALSAWRRGNRQRATVIGGSFAVAIFVALVLSELLNRGLLLIPFTLSFPFLIILVGIAYELSIDVARAHELARELHASEERMRLATDGANIGLWDWDLVREEVWFSDTIRERTGLDAFERIDFERALQLVHPDDRERVRRAVLDAVDRARPFELEYRERVEDGSTRWVVVRGSVDRANDGKALRVRGVTLDITDRKRAEESLKQSAEFNQQVLASLHHEIAILDRRGKIISVNDAWKAFARENGNGAGSVGANYLNVCQVAASSGDSSALRALEGIRSVLEGSRDFFEMEYPCGSPTQERHFLMRVVPLRMSGGGAVVSHVEITQLRQAEQETYTLRRELAHLSRVATVGQLSAALAHELSQPLGAILRNAEAGELFLQRDPPDYEELRSIFTDIKSDDHRAAAVIQRVRALLRREAPTYALLSVSEVLEQVIALVHGECQVHHVAVRVLIPDNLPRVRGDRVQLQQVILNLMLNALDAMDGAPVDRRQLTVTARRLDEEFLEVAVSDTGHGIPDERLSRVFEPFETSKSKGLGLGLAISKTIIESHGGRISVEHNDTGGATFRFTIRVAEPGASA